MTTISVKRIGCLAAALLLTITFSTVLRAQQLSREQWGAVPISVTHSGAKWVIEGKTNRVTLNEKDLALSIQAGPALWNMMPSKPGDMLIRSKGEQLSLRLADAKKISIVPYDAAFKTGVNSFPAHVSEIQSKETFP